eukprot:Hpha_TRINITY_DN13315_c0_g1::TRINITY_DN13315_c0_g1_i1::g.95267::m.95267
MKAPMGLLLLVGAAVGTPSCSDQMLVMSADTGAYSGLGEAALVREKMTKVVNITDELSHCAEGYEGRLGGQCTILITTGIGISNSAACAVEILTRYKMKGQKIKEALYMGTSGWSNARGGMLDPEDGCGAARWMKSGDVHQVGDVCVSSYGLDYNCGFEHWATNATTECMLPLRTGHDQSEVFSTCNFKPVTDFHLAEKVLDASKGKPSPAMPSTLTEYQGRYWDAVWLGFGRDGPRPGEASLRGPYECAEAASNTFWSGVPGDSLCRRYVANVVSNDKRKLTHRDVSCVSAMEAPGWMPVIARWGGIPFVNIRGNSNYAVPPLMKVGDNWLRNDSWINADDNEVYHKLGYQYAITSTTAVVLRYFGVQP